jgi:hypothetical protein
LKLAGRYALDLAVETRNSKSVLTIRETIAALFERPRELLLERWNWKAALLSALFRGAIFFFANLTGGWQAAFAAMSAEWMYRALTVGFYGSIVQAVRGTEPAWLAAVVVSVFLPALTHGLEFLIHWLRGTPNLLASISISMCFTAVSASFNPYAIRRGVLIVGHGSHSLASDLRSVPRLVLGYLTCAPLAFRSWLVRRRQLLL